MDDSRTINDPVHGHLTLPKYAFDLIDTPQFQRLRDLKQLGTSYYVFPGAVHNRFEHCLGVSHLANKMSRRLAKHQPELGIDARDIKLVTLAGLCHDLGHGPFSHAFEVWTKSRIAREWHHEDMSKKMLSHMIDDNNIDISQEDTLFIKELISGKDKHKSGEKKFLFDIVANMNNSIDVDKFDYLARDSINCGLKSSYDHMRLLKNCRVIEDEICFKAKEAFHIHELFHTRYSMHKRVYTHRAAKSIEFMISDILTRADPILKISDKVDDPEQFMELTDSIIRFIEISHDPELKPAQDIIKRLRKRDMYKYASEYLVKKPDELIDITVYDIIQYDNSLTERDVIIDRMEINYAMKDKNPVAHTRFFNKDSPDEKFSISQDHISNTLPETFRDFSLRIFVRDNDKQKAVADAFNQLLNARGCQPSPVRGSVSTPIKMKPKNLFP